MLIKVSIQRVMEPLEVVWCSVRFQLYSPCLHIEILLVLIEPIKVGQRYEFFVLAPCQNHVPIFRLKELPSRHINSGLRVSLEATFGAYFVEADDTFYQVILCALLLFGGFSGTHVF